MQEKRLNKYEYFNDGKNKALNDMRKYNLNKHHNHLQERFNGDTSQMQLE